MHDISGLTETQKRVMELLAQNKQCSSSDQKFAQKAKVSQSYLWKTLELFKKLGYVKKDRQKRQ